MLDLNHHSSAWRTIIRHAHQKSVRSNEHTPRKCKRHVTLTSIACETDSAFIRDNAISYITNFLLSVPELLRVFVYFKLKDQFRLCDIAYRYSFWLLFDVAKTSEETNANVT